MKIISNNKLVV